MKIEEEGRFLDVCILYQGNGMETEINVVLLTYRYRTHEFPRFVTKKIQTIIFHRFGTCPEHAAIDITFTRA